MKKIVAKRWRSDKKLSFVPLLSTSTSESVQSSPRGTRHIFFLSFLVGGITVWNFLNQELCDCFASECDVSQSCSSGVGSWGNSSLSFRPAFRNLFSPTESCCKFPRSWTVVDEAAAMLEFKLGVFWSRKVVTQFLLAWQNKDCLEGGGGKELGGGSSKGGREGAG